MEILTIHYGSFENLIRHAAKWGNKEFIDPEKHGVHLNKAKTQSPIILIDPVQADRNAAAALGVKKYHRFIQAANKFLHHPTEDSFEKKELTVEELKRRAEGKTLVLLEVHPLRGKEDVVGAKLVKALNYFYNQLKRNDFKVYDYNWKWNNKALFWFITGSKELSEFKEHEGPRLKQKKHVKKFRQKNRKYKLSEKRGRIFARVKRKYRKPEKLIKKLVKDEYVLNKVKSMKIL